MVLLESRKIDAALVPWMQFGGCGVRGPGAGGRDEAGGAQLIEEAMVGSIGRM